MSYTNQNASGESEAVRRERIKLEWNDWVKQVKNRAAGNWDEIMSKFAGDVLGHALDVKYGKHIACPFHSPSRDGFKLFKNFSETGGAMCNTCGTWADGWKLLERIEGRGFTDIIKDVGRSLGLPWKYDRSDKPIARIEHIAEIKKVVESPEEIRRKDDFKAKLNAEAWAGSFSIMSPEAAPLHAYLRNRGITSAQGPLDDLRFHPAIGYYEGGQEKAKYPTFLACLRQPDGNPMCLQRAYITADGQKAPVEKGQERKMFGHRSTAQYNGSAVRLDHAVGSVLCVSEGVETALAFRAMSGLPTWATCVAKLMEDLVVPDSVQVVIIAADKDRSGTGVEAATKLQNRLRAEGRKATIYLPPFDIPPEAAKGIDWNDVLLRYPLEVAREQVFMTGLRQQIRELLASMGYDWESAKAHF